MIYSLHGFFGKSDDWYLFAESLNRKYELVSLWQKSHLSLKDWAKEFYKTTESDSILIAYSMGGRLALHALRENPNHYRAAIFFSTNPGLIENREARLDWEKMWEKKILHNSWQSILNDWYSQEIFQNKRSSFWRCEIDFERKALAQAMRNWGLSQQEDFRKFLQTCKIPILWVTGEEDKKFMEIHQELKSLCPNIHFRTCMAGHRIPWQAHSECLQIVDDFLKGYHL